MTDFGVIRKQLVDGFEELCQEISELEAIAEEYEAIFYIRYPKDIKQGFIEGRESERGFTRRINDDFIIQP